MLEGIEVHITTNSGREYNYAVKLTFKTTNNEVEYKALLTGLSIVESLGATEVEVRVDFKVVVNQVLGDHFS